MKKFILLLILPVLCLSLKAQNIKGTITDNEGKNVFGATVKLPENKLLVTTDKNGTFIFKNLEKGDYTIEVVYMGFETQHKTVSINNQDIKVDFNLKLSDIITDEVVVSALKADSYTPIAYTNINIEDIEKGNSAQDIPYLLNISPSMTVSSDAGTGIGYTSMWIRGTDMTRINITLDGIPLNDSESHGVWWVNMPDFISSVDNIQIQRGAGTSTNGTSAFGANINFTTNTLKKNTYAEINLTGGSFNTGMTSFKTGTGLLGNHFTFDARYSKIHSDGYIDRARTDLESFHVSGTYADKSNLFRINIFNGLEETYQAWNGIPKDSLQTNRTYNYYSYENEIDKYKQTHYQIFYTRSFSRSLNFNIALHNTKGKGYYEQYKEDEDFKDYGLNNLFIGNDTIESTDLIRRKWLDNLFYGAVYSLKYSKHNINITLGGAWNYYKGLHYGTIIWSEFADSTSINHEWYRNSGIKSELNEYLKVNYFINRELNIWADLQIRQLYYVINGIHDDLRTLSQNHPYFFFNPKLGINYNLSETQTIYASYAVANREPSRSNYRDADEDEFFVPETLFDFETGYRLNLSQAAINFNLYYMNYKNQLILTGEINDVGAYIMSNIPESYRTGLELDARFKLSKNVEWNVNAAFSKNKIKNLTVFVDNWDTWEQDIEFYESSDISFSPDVIAGSELIFKITDGFETGLSSKFVSRQYIDNTSNKERSLNPYLFNNLRITYKIRTKQIKEIGINMFINNILNEKYETNAWIYRYTYSGTQYVTDGYFPQAGINFLIGMNIKF
jgi:iron complex outermembrane receptor protein